MFLIVLIKGGLGQINGGLDPPMKTTVKRTFLNFVYHQVKILIQHLHWEVLIYLHHLIIMTCLCSDVLLLLQLFSGVINLFISIEVNFFPFSNPKRQKLSSNLSDKRQWNIIFIQIQRYNMYFHFGPGVHVRVLCM